MTVEIQRYPRQEAQPADLGRLFVCWQTSIFDGRGHAVTDEEFTFGERADHGEFQAVCGAVIRLADSFLPPGRQCPHCIAFLRAHENARAVRQAVEQDRFRRKRCHTLSRCLHWVRRFCGRPIPGVSG